MPTSIADAVADGHPLVMLEKVTNELSILRYIEFELIEITGRLNMNPGLMLQKNQIPVIAKSLYDNFKNESLEDLSIAFKRGTSGFYNPDGLFRVDGAVIIAWIQKYLEEKYTHVEGNISKEKIHLKQEVEDVNYSEFVKRREKEKDIELTDRQKYAEQQRNDAVLNMVRLQNPRVKYLCDGVVVTAKNEHYACMAFKEMFDREPENVTVVEPIKTVNE